MLSRSQCDFWTRRLLRVAFCSLLGLQILFGSALATGADVEIIAHRGASAYEPENTLRAVRRAWEMGADATEIDIYLTKDGKIAVLHDKTVDRTTSGTGEITNFTLAELKQLRIRWNDQVLTEETIPSLEEVLAVVPPGKRIFIEIKTGPEIVPALTAILAATSLKREQLVIITFNEQTLQASKHALPDLQHYYLSNGKKETLAEVLQKVRRAGADGINLSHEFPVTAEVVQQAQAAGYNTYVWTIREKQADLVPELVNLGVVGLTTDYPDRCRTWAAQTPPE